MVSGTNSGIFKWNPAIITGIDNTIKNNDEVNIYPNPTITWLNIELSGISTNQQ